MVSADPQTLDAYRARAEAYAAIPPAPEQDAALARFLADLPEGGRILDLGCGPGLQAAAMQAAGHGANFSKPSATQGASTVV